jgi:hypothetical protein
MVCHRELTARADHQSNMPPDGKPAKSGPPVAGLGQRILPLGNSVIAEPFFDWSDSEWCLNPIR